jgi:hypothetical protein
MKHDAQTGSTAAGKVADLILVEGDPQAFIFATDIHGRTTDLSGLTRSSTPTRRAKRSSSWSSSWFARECRKPLRQRAKTLRWEN